MEAFNTVDQSAVSTSTTRMPGRGPIRFAFPVRDTGIGIAPENHARIFTGFTQAEADTTRRFGGTGLGVAISQRLVAIMGGELKLKSVLGQGSRFYFDITLPLGHAAPGTTEPPAGPQGPVLVVDENASTRDVLKRMGQSLGWKVELADSLEQAQQQLASIAQRGLACQTVFLDAQMPDLGDSQARQKVRELAGPARLVSMLRTHSQDTIGQGRKREGTGPDAWLLKPATASMLLEAARESAADEMPGLAPPGGSPESARPLEGLRLLIVEDNLNNQQVAQELLEDAGAQVQLAGHGQEALELLHAATSAMTDLQERFGPALPWVSACAHSTTPCKRSTSSARCSCAPS